MNLNNDKIGDEGLNHIANGFFISLNSLYLSYNNISSKGIKYLIKAGFTNNLILLSLSGNQEIGDNGIKNMKEHDGWRKLTTLNLYYTGLTDISLDYIAESSMPKLKKLNIQYNKFSDIRKEFINDLKKNNIDISYKTVAEIQKEKKELKEKKMEEKEEME